jgi:hypothetical protein
MKLQITNRRALLRNFNAENCTTAACSQYVGAEVLTDRNQPLAIGFKHVNGSGYKVLTFACVDRAYGTVECQATGFEETSKHLRCV